MPELHERSLGTLPENRILYALHQTGSRLVGDRFLAAYLTDCIAMVDGLGPLHKFMLASEGEKRGMASNLIEFHLAQADDNLRWAAEMKAEDYHRTNVLAFLSQWAAHEAGNENIIAAILSTIQTAAASAASKFPPDRYDMAKWPWSEDLCLEIAQKLDQKAKVNTLDGGWDAAARLATLYAWLGVTVNFPAHSSAKFNEASMVRNVLLHRYGRLGQRDIKRAPHLAEYHNKAVQLTRARLSEYHQAITDVFAILMKGITENGWK
jgi:hypothetical protein